MYDITAFTGTPWGSSAPKSSPMIHNVIGNKGKNPNQIKNQNKT